MRLSLVSLLLAFCVAVPTFAQSTLRTATTTVAAPVFLTANENQTPLRVAKEGSVLLLLDLTGDWCHVEFQDPDFGRRVGYIQTKYVRLNTTPSETPVNLSVPPSPGPAPRVRTEEQEQPRIQTDRGAPPVPRRLTASSSDVKSRTAGFFAGLGYEGAAIITEVTDTASGAGASLVLGYGFNPTWSLYTESSGADIEGATLAHFDVGARAHFMDSSKGARPFVQFGLSGRAISDGFATVSGGGVSFGGGVNAHFTPLVAFSGAITWSVGTFSQYRIGGVSGGGSGIRATSARVHLGLIWFPQVSHNEGSR